MDLCQGDIIWVSNEYLDPNSASKYWPAQFAKPTNIHDIINVYPYGPNGILTEQLVIFYSRFVVDTKDVLEFEEHSPHITDPELA